MSYTPEQVDDLFNFFDQDKSGKIPACELKNLFKQLGSDDDTADMKAKVFCCILVKTCFAGLCIIVNQPFVRRASA